MFLKKEPLCCLLTYLGAKLKCQFLKQLTLKGFFLNNKDPTKKEQKSEVLSNISYSVVPVTNAIY